MAAPVPKQLPLTSCWLVLFLSHAALAQPEYEPVIPHGHFRDRVSLVAISPQGKFVLTASEALDPPVSVILWELPSGRQIREYTDHQDSLSSLSFSPDGQSMLTGSLDKTAKLWDLKSGQVTRTLNHQQAVSAAAFSPAGKFVLTAAGKTAVLWDLESGQQLQSLSHAGAVTSLAFSADGKRAITGALQTITLWDLNTGKSQKTFRHEGDGSWESRVRSLTFTADGKQLLSGSRVSIVHWDLATGQQRSSFPLQRKFPLGKGHRQDVYSVVFSRDGKRVLTGGRDQTAILWDVETGEPLQTLGKHKSSVSDGVITPDGTQALIASGRSVSVWDLKSQKRVNELRGATTFPGSVGYTSQGSPFSIGVLDETLVVWNAGEKQILRPLRGHSQPVELGALSTDGKTLLTLTEKNEAVLWDVENGQPLHTHKIHRRLFGKPAPYVAMVAVTADRTVFATGTDQGVFLWDVETGKQLRQLKLQGRTIKALAFSPNQSHLLTGFSEHPAILWDVASGEQLKTLGEKNTDSRYVFFSPDGTQAVTAKNEGGATLWNVKTGAAIHTFNDFPGDVSSTSFAADGKTVMVGYWDAATAVFETATGKRLKTLENREEETRSVALSPEGKFALTTSSRKRTTRFWDLNTGKELAALYCFADGKNWLLLSPDNKYEGSKAIEDQFWYIRTGTVQILPRKSQQARFRQNELLELILQQ